MAERAHACDECEFAARSSSGLAAHVRAKHPPQREGYVFAETERSIKAAGHLTEADAGPSAVLRTLARTIDGMPERDVEAPMDNVTIPTYLKFAAELGLTPLARLKLGTQEDRSGSKLAELRAIRGGKAS